MNGIWRTWSSPLSPALALVLAICAGAIRQKPNSFAAGASHFIGAQRRSYDAPPSDRAATRQDDKKRRGQELFDKHCAKCHGENGKGEPMRPTLPQLPDFANVEWHRQRDDARLLVSILDGRAREMPAFRDKVTAGEARDLVAHVRQLGAQSANAPPADSPASDFEERFAKLEKELQELKRQFYELDKKAGDND
jgi:mono/diheme cytochrome c family protein